MNSANVDLMNTKQHFPTRRRGAFTLIEPIDAAQGGLPGLRDRETSGFTLIELLVVIAVIAILAGMLLAVAGGVKQKALVKRAEGELAQVDNAIARYKLDLGYYPPDNDEIQRLRKTQTPEGFRAQVYTNVATPASINSLYYELTGVTLETSPDEYVTSDGNRISKNEFERDFNVGGVLSATQEGGKNYLSNLKPNQHTSLPSNDRLQVLSVDAVGPIGGGASRFCYVSSAPVNNTETVDLWVDITIGKGFKRVSNWSDEPEDISY
jgi:prepilin-type N-terminal cleavage/methylation domain-containing protein